MAINLSKGSGINLTKTNPGLTRVRVGLGWDPGANFDLDASAFVCRNDGEGRPKLISDAHFVFYGNLSEPEGALRHQGDSRDGATSAGDADEIITVDLARVNPTTDEISFIVTIHEAAARNQSFGQVRNSFIAVYNDATGEELARYRLEDEFAGATAVQFGSLYKENGQWTFKAVGAGHNRDLAAIIRVYGGNV